MIAVLVRGRRAWQRQAYRARIRVSSHTKRLLAACRAYPREPLGAVVQRLVSWC